MSKLFLVFAGIYTCMTGTVKAKEETNVPIPTESPLTWQNGVPVKVIRMVNSYMPAMCGAEVRV